MPPQETTASASWHSELELPGDGGAKKLKALPYAGFKAPTIGTTKHTNVHDDGLSPSVMKVLATESRRHRGKAFSLLRVSVPPWQFSFTAKSTKERKNSS